MIEWLRFPGFARRRRLNKDAGLDEPPPVPGSFTPEPVDAQAYHRQIEQLADSLVNSVDEATGHALDNLINCWSDQWIAAVEAQYLEHLTTADLAEGRAAASAALTKVLWMDGLCRLVETGMAVEATVTHLLEEADAQSAGDDTEGGPGGSRG